MRRERPQVVRPLHGVEHLQEGQRRGVAHQLLLRSRLQLPHAHGLHLRVRVQIIGNLETMHD